MSPTNRDTWNIALTIEWIEFECVQLIYETSPFWKDNYTGWQMMFSLYMKYRDNINPDRKKHAHNMNVYRLLAEYEMLTKLAKWFLNVHTSLENACN